MTSPRALWLLAALIVGACAGAAATALVLRGEDAPAPLSGPSARGTLEELPVGPVTVVAETVRLGDGFASRHRHGGPTFNLVRRGRVEIVDEGGARVLGPGRFFFEPPERTHLIRALDDATLDVLRLLPPGARATSEVAPPP